MKIKKPLKPHDPTNPDYTLIATGSQKIPATVPGEFNVPFITRQLDAIKDSSSMVETYVRTLKARFNAAAQTKVLDSLVKYNRTVASGLASKKELVETQHEVAEALREYEIFMQDTTAVDDELEIKKMTRQLEKGELEIQLAEQQKRLSKIKQPSQKDSNNSSDPDTKDADYSEIFDDDK